MSGVVSHAAMGDAGHGVRLLLIDNYDSFTYNLVQAFLMQGAEVAVHRNDALSVEAGRARAPPQVWK
jgi:anthranilate/para-aminobenzoate synthase component II